MSKEKNNIIKEELKKILNLMLIEADILENVQDNVLVFNILPKNEKDIRFLIGWHGQNLIALQVILKAILSKKMGKDFFHFILDVSGYRQKRTGMLKNIAKSAAKKVKESKRSIVLDPMTSAERRIVHLALSDEFPEIITESIGEDRNRRVIIKIKE